MEVEKIPQIGILEWFHIGEYDRAEKVISILKELKITELRTGLSWAEWEMPEGKEWISWIIPHLGKEFKLLPCLVYTPPHLGIAPKTCSPPKDVNDYKKFVEDIILRFGHYFDYVELWNEPYNPVEWDTSLDPNYSIFSDMIRIAAEAAKRYNKKTVLGGVSTRDAFLLSLLHTRGALDKIDVIGVHGFPGTWNKEWTNWKTELEKIERFLKESNSPAKLWITETGFSTHPDREEEQINAFQEMLTLNIERIYWYSLQDLHPKYKSTLQHITGTYDPHEHFMGMLTAEGNRKPLFEVFKNREELIAPIPKPQPF